MPHLVLPIFALDVAARQRRMRGRHGLFEDHADDHLTVAIHLVEHARAHALAVEKTTDRGLELYDEEIHGLDLWLNIRAVSRHGGL